MPRQHPEPGHAALRAGRRSIEGQVYFVTFTTQGRRPLFRDWPAASSMSRVIGATCTWPAAVLLAWILMPDLWHGLVQLGDKASLPGVVGLAKGKSARSYNQGAGSSGKVWARGFHDRALRDDDDVRMAARYLVANPLRAGLVRNLGDYPYWNAIWLDSPVTL